MGITAGLQFTHSPVMAISHLSQLESDIYKFMLNFSSRDIIPEFRHIVERFDTHNTTQFGATDVKISDNELSVTIYAIDDNGDDPKSDAKIFEYLDEGTYTRRAMLSEGWESKTSPNSLSVRGGHGWVVGVSDVDLTGIAPRNFTQLIFEKVEPLFNMQLNGVISKFWSQLNSAGDSIPIVTLSGKGSINAIYGSFKGGTYGSAWVKGISAEHRSALARAGGLARQAKRRAGL